MEGVEEAFRTRGIDPSIAEVRIRPPSPPMSGHDMASKKRPSTASASRPSSVVGKEGRLKFGWQESFAPEHRAARFITTNHSLMPPPRQQVAKNRPAGRLATPVGGEGGGDALYCMTNQNGTMGLVRASRLNKEGHQRMERKAFLMGDGETDQAKRTMKPVKMPARGSEYLFVERLHPWR